MPTPPNLAAFIRHHLDPLKPRVVLDPCIGDGALVKPWTDSKIIGMDLNRDQCPVADLFLQYPFDLLTEWAHDTPDLILCNPPFSGAYNRMMWPEVFLRKLHELFPGTPTAMIVPHGFRLNQSQRSSRWQWLRDAGPRIAGITSLPNDIFPGVKFHTEIVYFDMEITPHTFLGTEFVHIDNKKLMDAGLVSNRREADTLRMQIKPKTVEQYIAEQPRLNGHELLNAMQPLEGRPSDYIATVLHLLTATGKPDTTKVRRLQQIKRLPQPWKDEFLTLFDTGEAKVTWSQLDALCNAYLEDRREGYVNGKPGPKLKAKLVEFGLDQETVEQIGETAEGMDFKITITATNNELSEEMAKQWLLSRLSGSSLFEVAECSAVRSPDDCAT